MTSFFLWLSAVASAITIFTALRVSYRCYRRKRRLRRQNTKLT